MEESLYVQLLGKNHIRIYYQDLDDICKGTYDAPSYDPSTTSQLDIEGDDCVHFRRYLDSHAEGTVEEQIQKLFYVITHVEVWFDSDEFRKVCSKQNIRTTFHCLDMDMREMRRNPNCRFNLLLRDRASGHSSHSHSELLL